MTTTVTIPPDCPTPRKLRYRTEGDAKYAAKKRHNSVGIPLYVYKCPCGTWHLTKQRQNVSDIVECHILGIGHALGVDMETFLNVTMRDVHGLMDPDEAEILRHPEVRQRWANALLIMQQRTETELSRTRGINTTHNEWRAQLIEQLSLIGERRREVGGLGVAPATVKVPPRVSNRTELRRTAGDRTIETLVGRHRDEFNEIFATEAERIGLEWRPPVTRDLTVPDIHELKDMTVNGETPARLASVHLVLSGAETFDEIVARLIAAVYRSISEDGAEDADERAARAARDIAIQSERALHRNVAEATHLARDWVTVHRPFTGLATASE